MSDGYYGHDRPELVACVPHGAARVLDCGCGEGALSAALKRERGVGETWGIEVVPTAAEAARQNPALDRVLEGDIATLLDELPDAHFDAIVAGDVLEHLVDPWSVLGALHGKLRPGGTFVASIPNIRNLSHFTRLFLGGRFEYTDAGVMDRTHLRFFARKDIRDLFTGAGFTDIDIGPVRPKRQWHKRLGRALLGDLVIKGFLITASRPV